MDPLIKYLEHRLKPTFQVGNRWILIRKNYGNRNLFFSWLIDGFVFHFSFINVICKYK